METRIKILILEHDPNDIGLLQYELEKSSLNFISKIVQTKEAYEKALRSFHPDIILADYSLPSFDGLSAFRIGQHVSPETPFIIVSGTIGEENAVELIRMGVTDYVLKENLYKVTPKIHRALKESTDRNQKEVAEQQLRQREEQLRKIMDLSLDVICTLDQQGRFITIGAACKSSWGYLPEELIGSRALDLVHEEDQESTYQAIADLWNGIDMVNFENRYKCKNGAVITLLWSVRWDEEEKLGYAVARDATAIKTAEEKIKNNEKRFRTLLQNSTDGLTLIAADGTIIERSISGLKILGYDKGEIPDTFAFNSVHPDDVAAVNEAFKRVRQNPNAILTVEYRFLIPDDSYKWLEATFHNQLHEPAIRAIVLNYRDITEKKLAEIALRTSEARLKQAQAIGHIGSWEMDAPDGNILWSDEIYRLLGLEINEIKPCFEAFMSLIHADDRPLVLARFEKAQAALENGSMGFRILRGNGEMRYVSSEWQYEFDDTGELVRIFGILQDITESKLAEIAAEKSEQKYRNLFKLSPIPMWVFDVDTLHFLDINEAAIKNYGYSKDEFLVMTLRDIRPPEEVRKLENLAKIPKADRINYQDPFTHIKKSGEVIEVDIKSSLIDSDGREARLVIATDISERIRYIQAIKEQNVKLREIAWIQSHVVRAPLARMMGLICLLNDYTPEQVTIAELINLISASAHELDTIIRDIVRKAEEIKDQPILEEHLQ